MQPQKPNRSNNQRRHKSNRSPGGRGRPRHPDAEVDQRIRELDAERDPLSLPEEIVDEVTRAGGSVGVPKSRLDAEPLNLSHLQQLEHEELVQIATDEGVEEIDNLTKIDLSFSILKRRMANNGLMYGEGTLEILPDGFGFLRSAENSLCFLSG